MSDQTYIRAVLADYKVLKSFMEDGVFESPTHRMKCYDELAQIEEELVSLGVEI